VIFFYAQILLWQHALKWAARLAKWTVTSVVMVAAAPVAVVTIAAVTLAWLRGWPPARLRRSTTWSPPMTVAYLAVQAVTTRSLPAVLAAPYLGWREGWHAFSLGNTLQAFALCAPVAVPSGLLIASWLWGARIYRIETGLAGQTATAPVIFDQRQWTRQARTARARNKAPGNVPLTDRESRIVIGSVIRAVGHKWQPALTIPHATMGRHQVIIGSSGSGKTNLMIRTWAGWYAAARAAAQNGAARPLLVVMDCKGGPDARTKAARTRQLLHTVGARSVATWPDEASLSLWQLPPRDLAVVLFQMLDTADAGPAAYYADITQAALTLAITAPARPPGSAAEFLGRARPRLARGRLRWRLAAPVGGPRRRAAPARHRPALQDAARPPRPRLRRHQHPRGRRRLVPHPGRHQPAVGRAGSGARRHRAARPCRDQHGHRAAVDPAGLRRLLGRVRKGPAVAALRTRPVTGHRRPGLRPVLARPRQHR